VGKQDGIESIEKSLITLTQKEVELIQEDDNSSELDAFLEKSKFEVCIPFYFAYKYIFSDDSKRHTSHFNKEVGQQKKVRFS
jgi:hypothetical protein